MEPVMTRLYLGFFPLLSLLLVGSEVGLLSEIRFTLLFGLGLAIFLVAALWGVRGYNLWVSLGCLGLGTVVGLLDSRSWYDFVVLLARGGTIVVFLSFIPSISVALEKGRYFESLTIVIHQNHGRGPARFFLLAGLLMVMSFVLNIGSIPTLQKLIGRSKLSKRFLSSIYSAGYSANILISPFDALVQATILGVGAAYGSYLFVGLGAVLFLFVLRALLQLFDPREEVEVTVNFSAEEVQVARGVSLRLALLISGLFVLTIVGNSFIPARYPLLLTGATIYLYSWIWGQSLGAGPGFLWKTDSGYTQSLLGYRGFLPFLMSAGFLGAILAQTPLATVVTDWVAFERGGSVYLTLLLGAGLTGLFSLIGIHMLISISILSAILNSTAMGLSSEQFALFLLLSWIGAMNISPLVPFSAVVGQTLGVSATRVSFRYNLMFGLGIIIFGPIFVLVF